MLIIFVRFPYLVFFSFFSIFLGWVGFAHAIGLGELHIQSGLGQSLQANVRLLGIEANEIDRSCIRVKVATTEGVFLAQAAVSIIEIAKGKTIAMSTELRLNEPAVKIAVDVNCEIQLHRVFLVLLDPPEFLSAILSNSPNADIKLVVPPAKTIETPLVPQVSDQTSAAKRKIQRSKLSNQARPQKEFVKIEAMTINKKKLAKLEKPDRYPPRPEPPCTLRSVAELSPERLWHQPISRR